MNISTLTIAITRHDNSILVEAQEFHAINGATFPVFLDFWDGPRDHIFPPEIKPEIRVLNVYEGDLEVTTSPHQFWKGLVDYDVKIHDSLREAIVNAAAV